MRCMPSFVSLVGMSFLVLISLMAVGFIREGAPVSKFADFFFKMLRGAPHVIFAWWGMTLFILTATALVLNWLRVTT